MVILDQEMNMKEVQIVTQLQVTEHTSIFITDHALN